VDVQRIWDKAPHNAFTDLIRFKDRWYCVFREGQAHISPGGKLRVITSQNGQQWTSAALMTWPGRDLRDPHLAVTSDGRLMVSSAAAFDKPGKGRTHQSVVCYSQDGTDWGPLHPIGHEGFWLWSAAWHKGIGYSIGYTTTLPVDDWFLRLYHSRDGHQWDVLADRIFGQGGTPDESSLAFAPDDTAYCLLRRDGTSNTAQLGMSRPPYTEWTWKDLGLRVGGPELIRLPDGRFLAAGRNYGKTGSLRERRTCLYWLDPDKGRLVQLVELPSYGDTSYPGMVFHDGVLWMSYHSSHEAHRLDRLPPKPQVRADIFLAKLKIRPAAEGNRGTNRP
jgi:hypothetical protein